MAFALNDLATVNILNNTVTTGSMTPTAGGLLLAWIVTAGTTATPATTVGNANGVTWGTVGPTHFGANRCATLAYALPASPTAGAFTITNPGDAGVANMLANFFELTGEDPGTPFGQVVSNAVISTAPTVALAAFGSASNATLLLCAGRDDQAFGVTGGLTQLHAFADAVSACSLLTAYQFSANLNPTASAAGTSTTYLLGLEIALLAAAPPTGGAAGSGIYRLKRRPWSY